MDIEKEIKSIKSCNLFGVLENTPMLKFVLGSPLNLTQLYVKFKDCNPEELQRLKDHYVLLTVNGYEDNFVSVIVYDIYDKDIDEPGDIKYYMTNKRNLQTMQKHCPEILSTFLYKNRNLLIRKFVDIINLAFLSFRKKNESPDTLIISAPYNPYSVNCHMQGIVDETIHTKFDVISEIFDNELNNKYYVIKERRINKDDNDAD